MKQEPWKGMIMEMTSIMEGFGSQSREREKYGGRRHGVTRDIESMCYSPQSLDH